MAKIAPLAKKGKGQQKGKAAQQPIKKAPQNIKKAVPQPVRNMPQRGQQQRVQQRMPQKGQQNGGVDPWQLLAALGIKRGDVQGVQKQVQQKGGGKGKPGPKAARGGAGPKAPSKPPPSKFAEKLKALDAEKKVWVGGLSKNTTWKQVLEHFETVQKPKFGDIVVKRDGSAVATLAYDSADDVASVVASLNGSDLNGKTLHVDTWEMPDRSQKTEKRKTKRGKKNRGENSPVGNLKKVLNTKMVKGAQAKVAKKAAMDPKLVEKLKGIDASLKVWVGGLSQTTTWKGLQKHFSAVGKPKLTTLMKKGRGVVCMGTEDEVTSAVAALNGSELDGATLEVDTWQKTERKPKN